MNLEGIIQIGEIINSHGVKGEVKVVPTTVTPELFLDVETLIVMKESQRQIFNVEGARLVKNHWLIKFAEVNDMTAAKDLKGYGIFTEEDNIEPLAEDEFFIHDLLNSKVYSTDDEYLGILTDYIEAGSQGVCEVTLEGDSFLFPTTREVLREVIPPDKVVINLIPGLRDIGEKSEC